MSVIVAEVIEVKRLENSLRLAAGHLTATYKFSSEEDCRQAEMLVEQIELARDITNGQ